MTISKTIHMVGFPSGLGAGNPGTAKGPGVIQQSVYLKTLEDQGIELQWRPMFSIDQGAQLSNAAALITEQCQNLASEVYALAKDKKFFTVLGGDHSCGIGTWSGFSAAYHDEGPVGLIWIDAHMDSHTPETSPTGNIHGMPLACLMGYGNPSLTELINTAPKIKPEHLCLIGIRSFEPGEEALLKKLNVKVFFIEDVKQRGLAAVLDEAIQIVSKNTVGFGVSIDIDSMEPEDAPGTGSPVENGINAKELCESLKILAKNPNLKGLEIAEFDPHLDQEHKTEKTLIHLIESVVIG